MPQALPGRSRLFVASTLHTHKSTGSPLLGYAARHTIKCHMVCGSEAKRETRTKTAAMTEADDRGARLLAQPCRMGGVVLHNRVAMAPMTRRQVLDPWGAPPIPEVAAYYAKRAAGGAALIITEGVHVNNTDAPDAPQSPLCRKDYGNSAQAWGSVAKAVHAAAPGHQPILIMQLWHTGIFSHCKTPLGPSSTSAPAGKQPHRAMSPVDMDRIADEFASTAAAAVSSGFDGVEIHGAHGYLLDSFASRRNVRHDEFGGSWANRARFPALVVKRVVAAISDAQACLRESGNSSRPQLIVYRFSQWSLDDFSEIKWPSSRDLHSFLLPLLAAGVQAFHVSCRRATDPGFPQEHSTRTLAGWTRLLTGAPVIAVGSLSIDRMFREGRDADAHVVANPSPPITALLQGEADVVAVGRAMLSDANWGTKVLNSDWRQLHPYSTGVLRSRL